MQDENSSLLTISWMTVVFLVIIITEVAAIYSFLYSVQFSLIQRESSIQKFYLYY